jgi:hypothetical protein
VIGAFLFDIVTMVGAYERFRKPTFLENDSGTGILETREL